MEFAFGLLGESLVYIDDRLYQVVDSNNWMWKHLHHITVSNRLLRVTRKDQFHNRPLELMQERYAVAVSLGMVIVDLMTVPFCVNAESQLTVMYAIQMVKRVPFGYDKPQDNLQLLTRSRIYHKLCG